MGEASVTAQVVGNLVLLGMSGIACILMGLVMWWACMKDGKS